MPIANCIITSGCKEGTSDLIELWARESAQPSEHMTVNLIKSDQQLGNPYSVMASLSLPSIWSEKNTSLLQVGLARALAIHFNLELGRVQVITNIVDSGLVVESGREVKWLP